MIALGSLSKLTPAVGELTKLPFYALYLDAKDTALCDRATALFRTILLLLLLFGYLAA